MSAIEIGTCHGIWSSAGRWVWWGVMWVSGTGGTNAYHRRRVFAPVLKTGQRNKNGVGSWLVKSISRRHVLRYRDDPTPMAIVPNIITADEVNCLIYSYLQDSGTARDSFKNRVLTRRFRFPSCRVRNQVRRPSRSLSQLLKARPSWRARRSSEQGVALHRGRDPLE